MNERMKLRIERSIFPQCLTTDDENTIHFDKYKFAELIVRECLLIPYWCIETGKDQLSETIMVDRIVNETKKYFGVK